MKFLFDTHIILGLLRGEIDEKYPHVAPLLLHRPNCWISVATIWEIAIKERLGKLECPVPVVELAPFLAKIGMNILPITAEQVTLAVMPEIRTRDPFDRLLVAVAQSESMKLVTADRALLDHPVVFRGEGARAPSGFGEEGAP